MTKDSKTGTGSKPGFTLGTLRHRDGAVRNRKRLGRGHGSGLGETAGKGVKGQKARTGHHGAKIGFEGGQMPMQRRLPKRGFKNLFRKEISTVNVGDLAGRFKSGTVDVAALKERGLVPRSARWVKVLGDGDLAHKLAVQAHFFSRTAEEKITKAGGTVDRLAVAKASEAQGVEPNG